MIKKHRKPTKNDEGLHNENKDGCGLKAKKGQIDDLESGYDNIDPGDIDMSSNVYDEVDTDKVEYETVQ